jgi:hypothetical protein
MDEARAQKTWFVVMGFEKKTDRLFALRQPGQTPMPPVVEAVHDSISEGG